MGTEIRQCGASLSCSQRLKFNERLRSLNDTRTLAKEVRMKGGSNPSANVVNGDHCMVVSGTHAGKSGIVRDRKTSATGHVTITVEQADGGRLKREERVDAALNFRPSRLLGS